VSPPADLLRRLVASDPGRPRVTVYDDTDSPTRGERVELSARVLANWVAKAANLLQEDLDVTPGSVVRLDLPPHWRTLYWALAVWSVGGCVELPAHRCRGAAGPDAAGTPDAVGPPAASPDGATVVVTDDPEAASRAVEDADHAVLVTLAALARTASVTVPVGAVDEAKDLATHGDVFDPWDEPDPADPALRTPDGETSYAELVPDLAGGGRVHTATSDTAAFLSATLDAWAGDGSVVLGRGEPTPDVLTARLAAEGVTRTA
jgi:uncharacterized protein (TIGR03089 family)